MEKELKALIQLIESWSEGNLEIAKQIMKGDAKLKKAIKDYYEPILSQFFGVSVLSISKIPDKLRNANLAALNLPCSEEYRSFFYHMPIRSLYYSYQEIEEIPCWIFEIKSLEHLTLAHNKIRKIPQAIKNLKNLWKLNLDYNEIREIPEEIGQLSRLGELRLANNKIEKIPQAVFQLKNLHKLQLDFNQIEQLPEEIGALSKLSSLCLEANRIRVLPKTILALKKLSWLSIEGTPLGDRFKLTYGMYVNVDSVDFEKYLKTD